MSIMLELSSMCLLYNGLIIIVYILNKEWEILAKKMAIENV